MTYTIEQINALFDKVNKTNEQLNQYNQPNAEHTNQGSAQEYVVRIVQY
ncbi:hypothetical protein JRY13_06085 [Lacticaseibacillus paracasei]|nr:hypothetical protein [Lacticaseibacillus paracasei]MBM6640795.1 hypothetical protein [Lacticaseibacillus paracasei]